MAVVSDQLIAGFADPVQDSQSLFRALLKAMSEPGLIRQIDQIETAPGLLQPAAWAVALGLFDADTPLWLSRSLMQDSAVVSNLRFHCQAPLTERAAEADFALTVAAELPELAGFNQGCSEYPDRSVTLVIQVEAISNEPEWALSGPGIESERGLRIKGLPQTFTEQLIASRRRFPLGVDCIFVCADQLVALPRSTQIRIGGV